MSKLWDKAAFARWDKAVEYYLTHDDIEIFLFVCCWGFLGWMMFHAFNGIMERIYC